MQTKLIVFKQNKLVETKTGGSNRITQPNCPKVNLCCSHPDFACSI